MTLYEYWLVCAACGRDRWIFTERGEGYTCKRCGHAVTRPAPAELMVLRRTHQHYAHVKPSEPGAVRAVTDYELPKSGSVIQGTTTGVWITRPADPAASGEEGAP